MLTLRPCVSPGFNALQQFSLSTFTRCLALTAFIILSGVEGFSQPTLQWAKSIGGTLNDTGEDIVLDASGNVYTTGYFSGTADFDPGAGVYNLTSAGAVDIFISKLDAAGNFIWARSMGGTGSGWGISIALDGSGNVYTTGYFQGTVDFDPSAGIYNLNSGWLTVIDIFISKLDANGNFLWAGRMGGTNGSYGRSIAIDGSGNVYTTGYFSATADFDPGAGVYNLTSTGSYDMFISKLDANGNFIWAAHMVQTSIGGGNEYGRSIAIDGSGNVYTTGFFQGTVDFDPGAGVYNLTSAGILLGSYDIFISKLDANGNFIWANRMGGTSDDYGYSIALDGCGNVYITGFFNGTADFDPDPAVVYNLTSPGGIFGGRGIFISKLDVAGNFLWAVSIGGAGDDRAHAIALDDSGNVYTTGTFQGNVDFDPGAGTYTLNGSTVGDIFISKLDTAGNFIWAGNMGGGGVVYDLGNSIALDGNGNVYTTGFFTSTADFDPGSGVYNLTSAGLYEIFVAKYCGNGTGCINTLNITITSNNIFCFGQCTGTATAVAPPSTGCGSSLYTYNWSNSQTTQTATGLCAGTYSVIVTDVLGTTAVATVTITQPIVAISAIINSTSAPNGTTTVNPSGGTLPYTYLWNTTPPQTTLTATGLDAGNYCCIITDANGCSDSSCTTITEEIIICAKIFVPNAFSPNKDGQNDLECVMGDCIETLYFAIYDRWGEKVFETIDQKICWDGTYNGKLMNTAVFVYYMKVTLINGQQITEKGNVSLIK